MDADNNPMPAPEPDPPLDPARIHQILQDEIMQAMMVGWRIESQASATVTLVQGTPINHILHALLSVFTCGLWLLIWALIGLTNKQKRMVVAVTSTGQVMRRSLVA